MIEFILRPIVLAIVILLFSVYGSKPYRPVKTWTPLDFVRKIFSGKLPPPKRLWIKKEMQKEIQAILGRPFKGLILRYWTRNGRYVYILEEIGKEQLITAAFVLDHGRLEGVKVLVYRESRGGEVQYPVFTDQFTGAKLRTDKNWIGRSMGYPVRHYQCEP